MFWPFLTCSAVSRSASAGWIPAKARPTRGEISVAPQKDDRWNLGCMRFYGLFSLFCFIFWECSQLKARVDWATIPHLLLRWWEWTATAPTIWTASRMWHPQHLTERGWRWPNIMNRMITWWTMHTAFTCLYYVCTARYFHIFSQYADLYII